MKLLERFYKIDKYLKPNKVLVFYGPRQVGKTTLLQEFLKKTKLRYKFDSGENIKTQATLSSQDFDKIFRYASNYELIIIDEAQKIPNIGMGLKILVDHKPGIKIIVTGSASFELAGQIGEPLTGRKRTLILFPLSQMELKKEYNNYELEERVEEWLVFGSYPAVITAKNRSEKRVVLEELVESYLFKDILELERVKSPKTLLDLLSLLALQVGSEVSTTELATQLGIDYKTVFRYLDLFEKSFILYNLRGYSRNLRKEVRKKGKYYFYDNGIRNAVISNFNDLDIRNDVGQLWENFMVIERLKKQSYKSISANNYFWRTWDQKEIDWVEEREGKLFGYEFKWNNQKIKLPKEFLETYKEASIEVINQDNYLDFVA